MNLDVRIINMPFAQVSSPSIAATQLKTVSEQEFDGDLKFEIEYLNHDFAKYFGVDVYEHIALSGSALNSGLGDWLFRHVAFPAELDNTAEYLRRYSAMIGAEMASLIKADERYSTKSLTAFLDRIIEDRRLHEADVVGFTSMFAQTVPSLAMAQRLRSRNPDQLLVMGGANCEGAMGTALAETVCNLDFIFSGPGLISFPQFLRNVSRGEIEKCADINGVIRCARSAPPTRPTTLHMTEVQRQDRLGAELDINVPVPLNYDGFLGSYDAVPHPKPSPSLNFETSRGCWWGERAHCTFCGLNGGTMSYRAMSPDKAKSLIAGLVERYGSKVKRFDCVDNIMPKEYVADVFADLRLPSDVSIFYEIKSDMNAAQVAAIASGGVRLVQPGIESLLTSTLKLMRKGTTSFQNIKFLKHCIRYKVEPFWNLLVGFPNEDPSGFDIYEKMIPSLHHLCPPSAVFPVRFDRYSPYHTNPQLYGLDLVPAEYYRYCYPFDTETIDRIAYYFQNLNIEASYLEPLIDGFEVLNAQVGHWRGLWQTNAQGPKLEVLQREGGYIVEDSRAGSLLVHEMSPREIELAMRMVDPVERTWAEEKYPDEFARLRALGLIFEERGRVMSLMILEDELELAEPAVGSTGYSLPSAMSITST